MDKIKINITTLVVLGEVVLGIAIIMFRPYTKIDWDAYR